MPRPFFIALGLGLVVVWLWRRSKTRNAAVQTVAPENVTPNQNGYAYPKAVARTTNPRPAVTSNPGPSAQETEDTVGIAHEDGTYTVVDPTARHYDGQDLTGTYGGDW